jgi:membrane protease YdiL (CAAX protease family)
MHLVDHLLVFLLFVVQPIYGAFEARRYAAWEKAGKSVDRKRFYRHTIWVEWAFLAVLGSVWVTFRRPAEDLGFVSPGGWGFWIGLVLLIVVTGLFLRSWQSARTASDAEKAEQTGYVQDIAQFVPQSAREMRRFVSVSITAGIVEEIVYRGFVLWYLAQSMPMWVAVIVSSVAFGIGHSYQGANGAARAGLAGLAFAVFYVGTGSIWLPIIAHALLDILQGATLYELLRKRPAAAKAVA